MRVVAGCDGGGTKCTVRIAVLEKSKVIRHGQATSGSANVRSDPDLALRSIREATRAALVAVELPEMYSIDYYVAALAGAGAVAAQRDWETRLRREPIIQSARVIPDVLALFAAANCDPSHPAIATVVGTGSIAWGRDSSGRMVRAGGLGPDTGDEGSGYWIAKQALARCREGEKTILQSRVVNHLTTAGSETSTSRIGSLARIVFEASDSDRVARDIVESAAQHIAKLITEVARKLEPTKTTEFEWLCAGGVAVNQLAWIERIRKICGGRHVVLCPPSFVREPVAGALQLAIEAVA